MRYLPPELWLIIDSFVNKLKFMKNKRKLEKILKFFIINVNSYIFINNFLD